MRPLGDVKRHFWLVQRMARTVGVDLGDAMRDGRISAEDHAETVTRCRGCACAGTCSDWLDTAELEPRTARAAPGYCENEAMFRNLARAMADRV